MKHATAAVLDTIEPLLAEIRTRGALREKSRGIFYRRSKAWLHFHEDPAGLFADLREGADFTRLAANSEGERRALLDALDQSLQRA
jgi:hypothetical protein